MAGNLSRPNPDELLAQTKTAEKQKGRGKLKIFLGYAAGVGKTYTMLEAARQRKKEVDVVVAYAETHGRAETEALLQGLEVIPRRQVAYQGAMTLTEMDLDAVLARHPPLALVDDLAHTNTPDSRHPKRYQDVEELLEAGIDVYTTLNIQHIESLRDMVAQIANVWIRETVPDDIVENASEIEIVDLPPDELLKRLKEGKVYLPETIAQATAEFFRKGNLTALRELTMRTAAQHVDKQTQAYMETHAISGPWPSTENFLVCISPSPAGTSLVRAGRRLAAQLGTEWFAIYVETPDTRLSPEQQDRLKRTLRLADRMGAQTATVQGTSVTAAVTEFATRNNITRILIGRPRGSRWRSLFGGSLVNQIMRRSENFDVYVISGRAESRIRVKKPAVQPFRHWRSYLLGLGSVMLATLLGELLRRLISTTNIIMLYLLCVVITAVFWGLGPSILVSVMSVVAFDYFFAPPFFRVTGGGMHVISFAVLLLVGAIISYLGSRVRHQAEAARLREQETAALYALSRDMAVANDLQSYIRAIIKRTKETFGRETAIFLPDAQDKESLKPYSESPDLPFDDKEIAAATWSFQHQRIAGHGTDTLPNAKARYAPLITARGPVGVAALWSANSPDKLTIEQERLLEAYADHAAVAIESILLAEEAHQAQALRASEKLQTALLNSISHDLRTPLISIIDVLSSLQDNGTRVDSIARKNLVRVAREEADRLNHLITNLLDMSRIEAGALRLSRQLYSMPDLVGAALQQLGDRPGISGIKVDIPADLPQVLVDSGLMVETLANILDNALNYSPPESPIEISARQAGQEIKIEVADRGVGIPPQDLTRIFDKFYRVQRPDNVAGSGLGLTICKGIVEAHGGRIWAENRPGGGTIIRLTLPVAETTSEIKSREG